MTTPQWQTGEIPEPDGPAAIYKKGDWYPTHLADLNANNKWFWRCTITCKAFHPQHQNWYIQPLTLPQP